jgi:toxin secretion/phage lysis holin
MTPLAIKNIILAGLAGAGAWIASALGGWDMALQTLLAVMVIDIITGLMVAAVWKKSGKSETGALESNAMFKGLCRKFVTILVIFIAWKIDQSTGLNGALRVGAILFFTGNEGLSIIENLGVMGVPMPPAVQKAIEALKKKGEGE